MYYYSSSTTTFALDMQYQVPARPRTGTNLAPPITPTHSSHIAPAPEQQAKVCPPVIKNLPGTVLSVVLLPFKYSYCYSCSTTTCTPAATPVQARLHSAIRCDHAGIIVIRCHHGSVCPGGPSSGLDELLASAGRRSRLPHGTR